MYWDGFGAISETYHTQQQQKHLHIGFVPPDKKLNNSRYQQESSCMPEIHELPVA